jgi:DNA-binding CsgD family transcriptional regulator
VLLARGRAGEAARLLGAAQALGESVGADLALVGRVTYAAFLATVQERLREAPFAAAWAAGRALSLDCAVDEALALTGEVGQGPPAPPPRTGPPAPSLTRREREVALLLARGKSDREIAAALAISPATASVHVHRILAKLALRSRHQVAAWVAAQDAATPSRG